MSYLTEGINNNIHIFFDDKLRSPFVQFTPILYFLSVWKKLGRVGTTWSEDGGVGTAPGAVLGGTGLGEAEIAETIGKPFRQILWQKSEPNDGGTIASGGTTPTATSNALDNSGSGESHWTHFFEPIVFNKHEVEGAKSDNSLMAIIERYSTPVFRRMVKRVNAAFWTGTLTAAQQNAFIWEDLLGLEHVLDATTYDTAYRVSRAGMAADLRPLRINAATGLDSTVITLDLARTINIEQGLFYKDPYGEGCKLFITTPTLWVELAKEADARGSVIYNDGIPDVPISGFKKKVICHDDAYFVADQNCPAGTMKCLNLNTMITEIEPGHNFAWSGLVDESKQVRGGNYVLWGNYDAKIRFTINEQYLNADIYNLTAA